jgi:hypothetical protein
MPTKTPQDDFFSQFERAHEQGKDLANQAVDSFFFPAQSDTGRSVLISTRVPEEMAELMDRIVDQNKVIWPTRVNLFRNALGFYLEQVCTYVNEVDQSNGIRQMLMLLKRWQQRNMDHHIRQQLYDCVANSIHELYTYYTDGNAARLARGLEDVARIALDIHDVFWLYRAATFLFTNPVMVKIIGYADERGLMGENIVRLRTIYESIKEPLEEETRTRPLEQEDTHDE